MQPFMRIVLPIIGLIIAASLGSPATRAFDLLVGAAVGFLIADLGITRARLDAVTKKFDPLKRQLPRPQQVPTASAPPREDIPTSEPAAFPEHKPAQSAPRAQPE